MEYLSSQFLDSILDVIIMLLEAGTESVAEIVKFVVSSELILKPRD